MALWFREKKMKGKPYRRYFVYNQYNRYIDKTEINNLKKHL